MGLDTSYDNISEVLSLGCIAKQMQQNWPTFNANINLVFIVDVNPHVSLTKPFLSGIFLTQKVCTTNQHHSFHF